MADLYGYPASPAQRRLWLLDRLFPGTPVYNLPLLLRFDSQPDPELLERSLNAIGDRHEALRTRFVTVEGEPVQVIDAQSVMRLAVGSVEDLPMEARAQAALAIAEADLRAPFDLGRGPVWRARLVRLSEASCLLAVIVHHIAADGWSMGLLARELAATYAALAASRAPALPELPLQYADFAIWHREWLRSAECKRQLGYWTAQLAGLPLTELPADRAAPADARMAGRRCHAELPPSLRQTVEALARSHRATPFMVLLAGLAALIHRHTGQADLPIGTPTAGRSRPEFENLIGVFVNTLVLRVRLTGTQSFAALIEAVREVALGAYTNQDLPFEHLVEVLRPERSLGRNPLCQVMLTLHNEPTTDFAAAAPLGQPRAELDAGVAALDLAFDVWPESEGWAARLEANLDIFEPATAEALLARWIHLLGAATARPELTIDELTLADETELREPARPARAETPFRAAHEAVAAALRTGSGVVLRCGEEALAGPALQARCAALRDQLVACRPARMAPVAVILERSCPLVTALLAILGAGLSYAPLDQREPATRLAVALDALRPGAVVTTRRLAERLPLLQQHGPVLHVDDCAEPRLDWQPSADATIAPTDLAYLIHTSGTTGEPKAVMVEHAALHNHLAWMQRRFPLSAGDSVLAVTAPGFDVSVWELLGPLAAGARLVLAPAGLEGSAADIAALLRAHRITAFQTTPAVLAGLLAEPLFAACPDLRWVFCGGEALPQGLARRFLSIGLAATLVNMYGPTEATIDSAFLPVGPAEAARTTPGGAVAIGGPIDNVSLHVLDGRGRLLPSHAAGELCIAGANLARGYLGDAALTAKRFMRSALGGEDGRIFRTGDRARRLSDGAVEVLGRMDRQVKLRGHRMELGAVEAALAAHPAVQACIVDLIEPGTEAATLLACVAADLPPDEAERILRSHLAERLPAAMVPGLFAVFAALPLTRNGKLDRRGALAAARAQAVQARAPAAMPPRTETERSVLAVWQALLSAEGFGVEDNFFDLGGHSLLASRVLAHLLERHGVELPFRLIFEEPTVAALAAAIDRARPVDPPAPSAPFGTAVGLLGPEEVQELTDQEVELLLATMDRKG